ncbi:MULTISPECIES: type VI-B CRISPR-associated RNA-guided ribonuclease Cas13b [Flavobacterium]|uniref:Type VI-B CRISPR-associated RNA-guided ribonuclease Cas13b n=1 Tax=Flavobacterium jumunjinense TaxID=998845 RepID=A0ABV5GMS6_9FLAO|nr:MULTISPECIES: type VI-B CRISPR-associated RNA-guided ribonuclease Cas13b [Flavobacterium]
MEDTQEKNKVGNKRTLANDPQYFGAYLNMARHNVFLIINHLTETFKHLDFPPIEDDENIIDSNHILANIFDSSQRLFEDERNKVFNYITRRHLFPFFKIFVQDNLETEDKINKESTDITIDYDGLHFFLKKTFIELNEFRNAYTHYLAIDDTGNRLNRKQKFDIQLKPIFELLFKYAPRFSYIRNAQTQNIEDYNHILKKYQLFEDLQKNEFTEQGIFFFINLFLERSYATKFLKRFKGFKNETTPPFRATIQAFTTYSLRIPDVRLGNDNPKESLLMEILSELNKCPKELFNHLTDNDKKIFDPKVAGTELENVILNSTNYEDINDEDLENAIKELTALKRHDDRFPYFALRFLDEMNMLEDIRFQVTIGRLVTKKYDKTIIGNEQPRRIIKTINAYGKLSDFENKEQEIVKILKRDFNDEEIKFEQFFPHYNMNNNKIAFYIFEKDEEKIKYPNVFENKKADAHLQNNPTGFISIHDLPKLLLLRTIDPNKKSAEKLIKKFITETNVLLFDNSIIDDIKNKVSYEPESFTKKVFDKKKLQDRNGTVHFVTAIEEKRLLSKYNLSKEKLYSLKKEDFKKITNNKKELESFSQIKYHFYIAERRKELQKHLPEGVLVNQLPEKLQAYLMGIRDINEDKKIHITIRQIKEDIKKLLKVSRKEPKENEKPKLGEYATYITRDILNMLIDENVKAKITQPYFNKLQNKIAFFSINKEDIVSILEELNIFDYNKGHVFLNEKLIFDSNGIIDFYQNYLDAKIKWITNYLLVPGKKGGYALKKQRIPYSFKKLNEKICNFNYDKWVINKTKLPVNLPTSLFDDSLNVVLKRQLTKKEISFLNNEKFSVLFRKYLENDSQPFYNFIRIYNIDKQQVIYKPLDRLTDKQIKSNYDKFVAANEKHIRFIQTKDRILKILCEALLKEDQSIGLIENIELKNIFPDSKKSILEHQASFRHRIVKKGRELYCTIIAEDSTRQKVQITSWEALSEEKKENWLVLDTKEKQDAFLQKVAEPEKQIYLGQKGYQWTIKDFGRFKRFIKDKRLPKLLDYFEEKEIPFDLLEYQIKEYDRIREKIFDLVFELEKSIVEKDFEGIKKIEFEERPKKKEAFNEIQFKIYLKWLLENNYINDKSNNVLSLGRKKFSHSEFPFIHSIEKITETKMADFEYYKHKKEYRSIADISIAQNIYELFEQEVNTILEEL